MSIDTEKLLIDVGKVPIDDILSPLMLLFVTKRHIMRFFEWFGSGTVFGRQHIVGTLQLKDQATGKLVVEMLRLGLVTPSVGFVLKARVDIGGKQDAYRRRILEGGNRGSPF